jgi:hypothetical protein
MKKQDLLLRFMKEQGCIPVSRNAEITDEEAYEIQLIRFVRGSHEYTILFASKHDKIALFKNKTAASKKRPYGAMPSVRGSCAKPKQISIRVDLSDPDSLSKLASFL